MCVGVYTCVCTEQNRTAERLNRPNSVGDHQQLHNEYFSSSCISIILSLSSRSSVHLRSFHCIQQLFITSYLFIKLTFVIRNTTQCEMVIIRLHYTLQQPHLEFSYDPYLAAPRICRALQHWPADIVIVVLRLLTPLRSGQHKMSFLRYITVSFRRLH